MNMCFWPSSSMQRTTIDTNVTKLTTTNYGLYPPLLGLTDRDF